MNNKVSVHLSNSKFVGAHINKERKLYGLFFGDISIWFYSLESFEEAATKINEVLEKAQGE